MLFVSGRNGAVVLEFAEKTLDEVAVPIQEGAERGHVDPIGHRLDVGPGTALFQSSPESVAVVPAVGQQGLACRDLAEKVARAAAVMRLAFGQLEGERQAIGVHEGVDLGGQAPSRAPHALGSSVVPSGGRGGVRAPFFPFPPCWWTRIEDESIICRSPS